VNTPAQYGIIEALVNPETRKWENKMVEEFRKRRDLVEEMIGSLLGYELGGAFYAAPKTPLHSEEFSKRLLEEEHVCVLPLSELSSGSHEYFDKRVRISYGTGIDLLEEGLARFRRFAEALQS
jgi:aspartate/methionine/tyrosine aminotransferase